MAHGAEDIGLLGDPKSLGVQNPFGGIIGDLGAGIGGFFDERRNQVQIQQIADRAGFQSQNINVGGFSGNQSAGNTAGGFVGQDAQIQQALGQQGLGMLGGQPGFGTGGLNQFLGGLDIGGQFGQTAGLLNQQLGNSAFGQLGGFSNQVGGLANQFGQQAAAGPQDFTGGLQNQLFQQGFGNQQQAGNQQGLFNQSLASQRAAAEGGINRSINRLQDRQFAQGRLGSTGGAQETQGFLDSLAQQDLGFQNNAFGQSLAQGQFLGQLGGQQIGQGAGLLGQNLGQFNQNVGNAQNFFGLGAGLEGQQFGQNRQALGQNQSAGLQRLQSAQGLLGLGSDIFGGAQSRGLQSLGLSTDRQSNLQDFSLGLRNAESDRIQAAGASSQALAGAGAGGSGGFLGSLLGVAGTALGGPLGGAAGKFLGGLF